MLLPYLTEITSLVCTNRVNLLHLKSNLDSLVMVVKRDLEATKLAYANKTKELTTYQKLGSSDLWRIANNVLILNKGKHAIPPPSNGPEVLSSASNKLFSKNSNFDDSIASYLYNILKLLRNHIMFMHLLML